MIKQHSEWYLVPLNWSYHFLIWVLVIGVFFVNIYRNVHL